MESRQSRINWAFKSAKYYLSPGRLFDLFRKHPKKSIVAAATLTLLLMDKHDPPITRDVFLHPDKGTPQAQIDEAKQLLGNMTQHGLADLSYNGIASHDCVEWEFDITKKGLQHRKKPKFVSLDPSSFEAHLGILPHYDLVRNVTCQFHVSIPRGLPALRQVAERYSVKHP